MKIKQDDYIEDILKCFYIFKGVFSTQINWIYDWKNKWNGVNYESMYSILKLESYLTIDSRFWGF